MYGHVGIVKLLVEADVDVNAVDNNVRVMLCVY